MLRSFPSASRILIGAGRKAHPLLQRKLIRYLREQTSNQYFIATHSPSFINTPEAAIFDVNIENEQTYIKEAILRSQWHSICSDLGTKASDIVQSNAVIWVEGPSDRIYWQNGAASSIETRRRESRSGHGVRIETKEALGNIITGQSMLVSVLQLSYNDVPGGTGTL